ncbi:MAG TPA: hypothetical protein VLT86_15225 [Vicinamibacterales bacterium]|nr:hypothetical protein [Vicinamibacterales bacterium]
MISRLVQYGGRLLIVLALVGLPVASARVAGKQKDVPAFSGTWKLNVDASTNPNGPAMSAAPARGRAGAGGGGDTGGAGGGGAAGAGGGGAAGGGGGGDTGGGGGGGGGGDTGGGGGGFGGGGSPNMGGSAMSAQENQRLQAALAGFRQAPPFLGLQVMPGNVGIGFDSDPTKGKMWKHTTDDKKQVVQTPWGPMDAKVKWDGQTLHRELIMHNAGDFKVVEDYKLSPDGKQLIMTLKTTSTMTPQPKIQQIDIKRVYDRVQ